MDHSPGTLPTRTRTSITMLRETHESDPIQETARHTLHEFPDQDGLDDYLLAIDRKRGMAERLTASTSLTGVEQLLSLPKVHGHTGQKLMELDKGGMAIHLRQPSRTVRDLAAELQEQQPSRILTATQLTREISAWVALGGPNPFIPLLDTAYQLGIEGYQPHITADSLSFDRSTGKLALTDQMELRQPFFQRPTIPNIPRYLGEEEEAEARGKDRENATKAAEHNRKARENTTKAIESSRKADIRHGTAAVNTAAKQLLKTLTLHEPKWPPGLYRDQEALGSLGASSHIIQSLIQEAAEKATSNHYHNGDKIAFCNASSVRCALIQPPHALRQKLDSLRDIARRDTPCMS